MSKRIILDRRIVDDPWQIVLVGQAIPQDGDLVVPLDAWLSRRDALQGRSGRTGVWLKPDDEPAELAAHIASLPLIAVQFPQFADGRGYSTARLLRQRHRYQGELRAIGEVLRDQLFYLARVGFNAFEIAAGKSIEDALAGLGDFSDAYQGAVDQPLPAYRRRPEGARP